MNEKQAAEMIAFLELIHSELQDLNSGISGILGGEATVKVRGLDEINDKLGVIGQVMEQQAEQ